jgi:hypothetical protein
MSDEPKERNILKLILIVRFACATLDVGHPGCLLPNGLTGDTHVCGVQNHAPTDMSH